MAWDSRGARKGSKRTPEALRRKVIARDRREGRGCHFGFAGLCIGIDQKLVEVHHVVEAEDGGQDVESNLATACKPCHVHHSAQVSQKRSVEKAWDWRKTDPRPHPGRLD